MHVQHLLQLLGSDCRGESEVRSPRRQILGATCYQQLLEVSLQVLQQCLYQVPWSAKAVEELARPALQEVGQLLSISMGCCTTGKEKHGLCTPSHPRQGPMLPLRSLPQALSISAICCLPGSKKLAILVQIVLAYLADEAQVLAGRKQDLLQSRCLSVRVPKLQLRMQGLQVLWQALCPSSLGARIPAHKDLFA